MRMHCQETTHGVAVAVLWDRFDVWRDERSGAMAVAVTDDT